MTWLGDTTKKPSEAKKAKLENERAILVKKVEELQAAAKKGFRFPHQAAHNREDQLKLAHDIAKIDHKLGRHVDWNSGER